MAESVRHPGVRTRQCSHRMAHWARDGSEGGPAVVLRLGLYSGFFVLPRRFFMAWFLASLGVTASGSGKPSAVGQQNVLRAPEEPET